MFRRMNSVVGGGRTVLHCHFRVYQNSPPGISKRRISGVSRHLELEKLPCQLPCPQGSSIVIPIRLSYSLRLECRRLGGKRGLTWRPQGRATSPLPSFFTMLRSFQIG